MNIKSMTQAEIAQLLKDMGQPAFRAKQVYTWLHKGVRSYDEMTNLPKSLRDKLSKMNAKIMGMDEKFDPFYGAPVVLVVLADKTVSTHVYDGSLVMGNLMLAAHALGLGSCWIHRAREEFESEEGKAILKELGIEGEYEGIGHCVIGYADGEEPQAKPRKENWVYYIR